MSALAILSVLYADDIDASPVRDGVVMAPAGIEINPDAFTVHPERKRLDSDFGCLMLALSHSI
jgi:hypothetical protein